MAVFTPVSGLEARLKQYGETCVVASTLYSVAKLREEKGYISRELEHDLESALSDRKYMLTLYHKMKETGGSDPRGGLELHDAMKYLGVNGYEVEVTQPDEEKVLASIEANPVIALSFSPGTWWDFYGNKGLEWWACHVICGIERVGENLRYFEPMGGEQRCYPLKKFREIYGGNMTLISPPEPG